MKSLYLRVWLTIVAVLAVFALLAGLLFKREVSTQQRRAEATVSERLTAMGDLIEFALPNASAGRDEQATALRDWSRRLRMPMALDDAAGQRIAASESFLRRTAPRAERAERTDRSERGERGERGERTDAERALLTPMAIRLDDGRTLWVVRPRAGGANRDGDGSAMAWWGRLPLPPGMGLVLLLGLLFAGVAAGAYPVVRRLTRRLESLKSGVEQFGSGALSQRVPDEGRDEVAAVARSFNQAAGRIEALVRSNRTLLANASHELRSPLARMKVAVSMLEDDMPATSRDKLRHEIHTNIAELDALVDEVLVASRLDAQPTLERHERVELVSIVLEEAARVAATVDGASVPRSSGGGTLAVRGDDKLLRRAVRNLLENARRYGAGSIEVAIDELPRAGTERWLGVRVADRGKGVPEDHRERIFEPFFRLPGHAEREGGTGLGLSLVRQIATQHGGHVRCEARAGGGSVFVLTLPLA
jgi:signal transduction histidine kinase